MISRPIIAVIGVFFMILMVIPTSVFSEDGTKMSSKTLLENADSLFNSREYEQARPIYQQAADMAQKDNDNSSLTEAYSMIARTFLITNQMEQGRPWIEKASGIASTADPLGWSRYLGVRGRFEWQDNENRRAYATFREMYEFCSNHKLHERAIDAAHMAAIVGTPEEQVEWGLKGIAEAKVGGINRWLGPLWNNLGATYEDMGKFKESLEAYLKAREYHQKHGDARNKAVADWAVGHAYRLNGDFKQAEEIIQPLLDEFNKIDDTEFIGWTHNELGEIENQLGNYTDALEHFRQAAEYLKLADMPSWDPDGYQKLLDKLEELKNKLPNESD